MTIRYMIPVGLLISTGFSNSEKPPLILLFSPTISVLLLHDLCSNVFLELFDMTLGSFSLVFLSLSLVIKVSINSYSHYVNGLYGYLV